MAFWGKAFVFNDFPCEEFGLMLYDIGNETQGEGTFASTVSIVEEVVGARWKPWFYGVRYEKKLQMDIIFGVDERRLDKEKYLDRYEIDEIASWLTGHDKYLWLEIEQEDMEYVRYHCMISELSIVSYGNIPWAMKASVICDSPYAYLYPQEFTYAINGTQTIEFLNESSHNGYYMPILEIKMNGGGSISITNETDKGRTFKLTNVPAAASDILVNNDTCVITNNADLNLYPYFNFKFFRLVRGYNTLSITGNCTLTIRCEFPINAGG